MTRKKCIKCGEFKSLDDFYTKNSKTGSKDSRCKLCEKERHHTYYITNKEKIDNRNKKWCSANKERRRETERKREIKNRDITRKRKKKYQKRRRKNVQAKLEDTLRRRIGEMVRKSRTKRAGSATRDLGCSIQFLKQYLEEKFYNRETGEKMSWNNYGIKGWHIDHIVPLSHFNLSDREQFLEACHYTNLQPLWAEDNIRKGNKL